MNGKRVLLVFFAGAVVAGVGTLLFAPTSGKNLRKNIVENKEDFQEIFVEIKSKINQMKQETVSATHVSKEVISVFISEVKDLIQSWKKEIEPHKNEIQFRIKEIENALGELEQIASSPGHSQK